MKKVKVSFDTLIQLLGMLGVLGGLVFVGLEMQQSQRIAMAGQQQERTAISTQQYAACLLYTSPSPRDYAASRMPSSA